MARAGDYHHTILVVDDFEDTRRMIALELRQHGYRVIEAANGREALDEAGRGRPDLILMDLSLPGLDGLSAVYRLREAEATRGVPVVACSAHSAETHRKAALGVGCDEYVTKPVDLTRLVETIDRLLSGRQGAAARNESAPPPRSDDELLDYIENLMGS